MTSSPRGNVYRVAVVGTGPRGMMVLERLAARLAEEPGTRPVEILAIDAVEVGAGRIYRSDQPEWFLMNTVLGQISAFSGLPDDAPARAGAGPSFWEWWESAEPGCPGPDGYAPRYFYGRYLRFVLDAIESGLPDGATLRRIRDQALELTPEHGSYRLRFAGRAPIRVDRVVLTTGHSTPELTGRARELADFAARTPGLRYIAADSATEMRLDDVAPKTAVGVLGLGLSFYDVVAAFTIGRGGVFRETADGRVEYRPSGREPLIAAGSRSGAPLPARGRNQQPPTYSYNPLLFRPEHVRIRPQGLDFRADVLPWLLAETDLVHCGTELAGRFGPDVRTAFADEVAKVAFAGPEPVVPDVRAVAARFGPLPDPIDLDALARPFEGRHFADPAAFTDAVAAEVRAGLVRAAQGNVDSPLNAALDVMRDTRWVLRKLVDFGGLRPGSQRDDFLGWYVPRAGFLAAGPPAERLHQLLALLDAGVLRLVGPETRFETDAGAGHFVLSSPHVAGSAVAVEVLIDARIPTPDVRHDSSSLTRGLYSRGVWTSYVNRNGTEEYDTGGVAVTGSPFHPIGRHGRPDTGLYVLGIPTEHARWFMQVGSSRPGKWSDFVHDADAIAASALAPARKPVPVAAAAARSGSPQRRPW
ncbi:FAD/NAD(P)-binding protein [Amycolatopsis sp. NPDC049252]|uniref:FAD/NAD(P)-binding protein n=1 Tax=Amycolatopsis sp. NPDC049252 TaxID=3363933 RepID=UPI003713C1AF